MLWKVTFRQQSMHTMLSKIGTVYAGYSRNQKEGLCSISFFTVNFGDVDMDPHHIIKVYDLGFLYLM